MWDKKGGIKTHGDEGYVRRCRFIDFDSKKIDEIKDNVKQYVTWSSCNEIEQDEENLSVPMCELKQCTTTSGQFCIFPFKFAGRTYSECITLGSNGTAWCSTRTDEFGNHISGFEEECTSTCSVNNCPTGYQKAFPENTCYKVR